MNIIDIALTGMIVLAVFMAGRHIYHHREKGCSGCCAECDQSCSSRPGK